MAPGGALGNDGRAEQLGPARDVVQDADHQVQLVADRDRRELVDALDPEASRRVGAEHRHPVRSLRVAEIRETSGLEVRPHRPVELRRGRLHGELEGRLVEGVAHGRGGHQRVADVHVAHRSRRNDAVQAP